MNRPTRKPTDDAPETVEDLQLEIVAMLPTLLELVPLVAALSDSHQAGVGFMSYEARQIENTMIRKEHRLQIEAEILGRPLGHGATAAPGNVAAMSAHVEIWAAAHHSADRLLKWLDTHPGTDLGITFEAVVIPQDGGTATQLLRMLRPLVWQVTERRILLIVRDDLDAVQTVARRVIDGPVRAYYPDVACPHCGRPSLLANFSDGLVESVTCDKDQTTGERHACTCSDPLCACKERPISHRHTWYRVRGNKPDGLLTLSGRLKLTQASTQKGPAQ